MTCTITTMTITSTLTTTTDPMTAYEVFLTQSDSVCAITVARFVQQGVLIVWRKLVRSWNIVYVDIRGRVVHILSGHGVDT
jgi:hypothetical protein